MTLPNVGDRISNNPRKDQAMKQLANRVEQLATENEEISEEWRDDTIKSLQEAACHWASAACDTYTGEVLTAALRISESIVNFTAKINK